MEFLIIIGIILLVLILFVIGGLFGWGLKAVQGLFSFLFQGWTNILGCFLSVILGGICLYILTSLFFMLL